ncbi:MAG: hypothetical protein AMXMBFR61_01010 [Fimbriimonadales bacterium]
MAGRGCGGQGYDAPKESEVIACRSRLELGFVTLSLCMLALVALNLVMLSLSKHDLVVRMVAASDATLAACGCMLRQAQHDG